MRSPQLLVIGCEHLRTPSVLQAFEENGWTLSWASLLHLQLGFVPDAPDMVLLDSMSLLQAPDSLDHVRGRFKATPLVLVGGRVDDPLPFGVGGILDTTIPEKDWPSSLSGFMAITHESVSVREGGAEETAGAVSSSSGLTSEDLFGDIVADLADGVVLASDPSAQDVASPNEPPLSVLLTPLVAQAQVEPPVGIAEVSPVSSSAGEELRNLFEDFDGQPLPVKQKAAAPEPEEFTLDGISGIEDPFIPDAEPPAVTKVAEKSVPLPAPVPVIRTPIQSHPVSSFLDSPQVAATDEFGNYYLLEKIAVGGMAELFKARQRGVHDFQKTVAIKRILPHLSDNDEFVRMFIDEAKLAAQLTHPNIVQIFELGKVSGFYYIAMEYVDGRDLRSMLRKVREFMTPFPESVAAFVVMKVAGALDYAHRKRGMDDRELKLVHRDVSPQNILISSEGAVKLVDFGIAKAVTKTTQTVAGALKGKLLYMSPEQALGTSLDHRSDIYSLGLVLFELLTGERCFQADSELGVLEKVRMGKVLDARSINPAISQDMIDIINRALAKDLNNRYESARHFERDLKSFLTTQTVEPTEHDVADFANALLKGTKEQLGVMLATRFKTLPRHEARAPLPEARVEKGTPTGSRNRGHKVAPETPLPPVSEVTPPSGGAARWVLPILLAVGAVSVLLWFVSR